MVACSIQVATGFEILNYPGAVGKALLQEQLETDPSASSAVLRDSLGPYHLELPLNVLRHCFSIFHGCRCMCRTGHLGIGDIAYSIWFPKNMPDLQRQGA